MAIYYSYDQYRTTQRHLNIPIAIATLVVATIKIKTQVTSCLISQLIAIAIATKMSLTVLPSCRLLLAVIVTTYFAFEGQPIII